MPTDRHISPLASTTDDSAERLPLKTTIAADWTDQAGGAQSGGALAGCAQAGGGTGRGRGVAGPFDRRLTTFWPGPASPEVPERDQRFTKCQERPKPKGPGTAAARALASVVASVSRLFG